MGKGLGFNPYLPSWEYIPDGEPHVFGDRVYVFGSHDRFNGYLFCQNDYICYSAPVSDITDWKYEGVIYKKTDDPRNRNGEQRLFAPDVTQGPDGRYYLYYVLHAECVVSVAVCDTPAGKYEFLGYVHYEDGTILGEDEGDEAQFDPGVLTEGEVTYLYTGFTPAGWTDRHGAMVTVLDADMLTIKEKPQFVVPSVAYARGTGYEGHEFFEASSIRKVGETYYFVYSSIWNHELCYATSTSPTGGFVYRGVIVSNVDHGIGTYKDPERYMANRDNNHGGFECINGQYYIFYHRHTNNYSFSRQGCLEPITILEDGSIPQVEMTSAGPLGGTLAGEGYIPGYVACNIFHHVENPVMGGIPGIKMDPRFPFLTQEGKDGDENPGYVANMHHKSGIGYKYFDCKNTVLTEVLVHAHSCGADAVIEVTTVPDGEVIGTISLKAPYTFKEEWRHYPVNIPMPDGKQSIFFTKKGSGTIDFGGFVLAKIEA